jgi:lipopolysaccharide export system permease protein
VIKKLDKLVLRAFTGPFIATFFIALFVLMMQIIWKYIDDLVGKGLDLWTISKFVVYASATMVTLALPIAILLSSIMTFGKLGESFELVAIKSSGIPLLRFMRPLFFIAILLCGVTFLFANYIIPVANLKFAASYNAIYRKSPAFDLKEGVFYNGFKGYAIKVGKKEQEGNVLKEVLIYEQSTGPQDNVVIADKGVMNISKDGNFLELKLENGYRYQEKGELGSGNNEFIRLGFKEYNKLFDLTQLALDETPDSIYMKDRKMQNILQLDRAIDSLKKYPDSFMRRTNIELANYINILKQKKETFDSLPPVKTTAKSFDDIIPDSVQRDVNERSLNILNTMRNTQMLTAAEYEGKHKDLRLHQLEWHKKFALSTACLVLFFIGAPLGSIIRKGGLGLPLLMSIIFFLIFHLLNMFGEKFVKEGIVDPFSGMWLAVFILTPLGIFLTYKAMHDSQLLNKEFYYRAAKKISSIFRSARSSRTKSVTKA